MASNDDDTTLLGLLRGLTLPLVSLEDGDEFPRHSASGFVLQRDERCHLISAAHEIASGRWFVELDVFQGAKPALLVPLTCTWSVLASLDGSGSARSVDLAWAEIDVEGLRKQAKAESKLNDVKIQIPVYKGPLDVYPDPEEAFSLHAFNKAVGEKHPGIRCLERRPAAEMAMTYVGDVDDAEAYRFKLSRQHQGHYYYCGASGAPISDSTGRIVSILLRGNKETSELLGARLAAYASLIGAIE